MPGPQRPATWPVFNFVACPSEGPVDDFGSYLSTLMPMLILILESTGRSLKGRGDVSSQRGIGLNSEESSEDQIRLSVARTKNSWWVFFTICLAESINDNFVMSSALDFYDNLGTFQKIDVANVSNRIWSNLNYLPFWLTNVFPLHPRNLTWNLKITCLKRKLIWTKPPFSGSSC